MDHPGGPLQNLVVRSFERLLRLYPPHFRREFAVEIRAVFLQRMQDAGPAWWGTALLEVLALALSVLRESWYEGWVRKGSGMESEDQVSKNAGGGVMILQRAGAGWVAGWILLTTAVYPAALVTAAPCAVLFMGVLNLGTQAGLWPAVGNSTLGALGFITSLALGMAAAQAVMLRGRLPRTGFWFAATAVSIGLSGLSVWWVSLAGITASRDLFWIIAAVLLAVLAVGLVLGLAQWLCLRRSLPGSIWIIPIDVLAAASILLLRPVITTYAELAALLVLAFPGTITGLGLWLLFRQAHLTERTAAPTAPAPRKSRWLRGMARVGLGLAVLVPLFFFGLWAYAASQLALAKNAGVYPTVEAAVIGNNSQGWGGTQVVNVESVRTGPNRGDGLQSHVWFGTATVTLDRVPEGWTRSQDMAGSYYIHVRDGWVLVGEGAFPEFIGWVMEFYRMEGVHPPQR